jgi:drug/metabolite transporter (DMT)-like permease
VNNALIAHICLFAAQVIYALNYSIAKDLMPKAMGPLGLVLLRIGGACALFWVASLFVRKEKVERADMKKFFLLALFGVAINQGFFIYGLSITEPINSAIIMISNPIAVVLFTLIFFKEKITVLKVAGLGLGISGALTLLLFRGNFSFGSKTILGDLFTLINSMSWAVFIVMAKPYMMKYHTVTVMKWIFLVGFLYFLPVGSYDLAQTNWNNFDDHLWFALFFVIIATTFLAYLLNTYALKALSSSVVAMYIYLQPFLATTLAVYLGKDQLTPIKILSGVLIISGVWLASMRMKKQLK